MTIRFAPQTDRDLDDIRVPMEEGQPAVAESVIAHILQSIRYLDNFPRLGRPGLVPDTRKLSIYELPYYAVCRMEGDIIFLVPIIHTSRQFPYERV